jgi:hypothetical protein
MPERIRHSGTIDDLRFLGHWRSLSWVSGVALVATVNVKAIRLWKISAETLCSSVPSRNIHPCCILMKDRFREVLI